MIIENNEIKVWIAHSEGDGDQKRILSEWLDRQLICVLNDYAEYMLRSGDDYQDMVTKLISHSDFLIVIVTEHCIAEDLIAQIKRARVLHKPSCVLFWNDCLSFDSVFSSQDLAELLSGLPHFYYSSGRIMVDLLVLIRKQIPPTLTSNRNSTLRTSHYSVFISKKSQDYALAYKVYEKLISNGVKAFLSEASLPELGCAEYMKAIDDALEVSQHLVVVGSSREYLLSGWVEAEWRVFINEKRSGHKIGNVVTMISDALTPEDLPMSLRYYEVMTLDAEGLERLMSFVQ